MLFIFVFLLVLVIKTRAAFLIAVFFCLIFIFNFIQLYFNICKQFSNVSLTNEIDVVIIKNKTNKQKKEINGIKRTVVLKR